MMKACRRSVLALAPMLPLISPAFAQSPVGNVTIKVHNTFGSSVGNSFRQCAGCTFSPPLRLS